MKDITLYGSDKISANIFFAIAYEKERINSSTVRVFTKCNVILISGSSCTQHVAKLMPEMLMVDEKIL